VLRFFEAQGMSRDDIQRMMGGSERDSSEVLSEAANKALGDRTPALTQEADAALKKQTLRLSSSTT